jgi:hypothetical protein
MGQDKTGVSAMFKEMGTVENETFLPGSVRVSADFKHITYAVRVGERQRVVVDGKEHKIYDGVMIGTPMFLGNTSQVVYIAKESGEKKGEETVGDKWFLVLGDKGYKKYDFIAPHSIITSRDNKRMVYIARMGEQWMLVEGAKEYPGGLGIEKSGVMFGPDGNHLVYVFRKESKYHIYRDGTIGPGFPWIDDKSLTFSPDGKHLVYIAGNRREQDVWLNNQKIGTFTNILTKTPDDPRRMMGMRPGRMSAKPEQKQKFSFGVDGKLRFFAIKDKKLILVVVKP